MDIKKNASVHMINSDAAEIEKACVYVYMNRKNIVLPQKGILYSYQQNVDAELVKRVETTFFEEESAPTLFDMVAIFEAFIPSFTKKESGITYTPRAIADQIIHAVMQEEHCPTICDPACGCGVFLLAAAYAMHEQYGLCFADIIQHHIFGMDIDERAVERTKVLLELLLLENHETYDGQYNVFTRDMLNPGIIQQMIDSGMRFDAVVGNPPYVRARNMPAKMKQQVCQWQTAKAGNADMYMPFFEIGLLLLNENGRLGYITPNGYLQAVNGRALRNFFAAKKYDLTITNFKEAQMFDNATTYTCITVIDTGSATNTIKYICETPEQGRFCTTYLSNEFGENNPWRMFESKVEQNIAAIEHTGQPLSTWKIRNGLATLANDVFFFSPSGEDSNYYYRIWNDKVYAIEKGICIKVAKPNVIHNEDELQSKMEYAIFPYKKEEGMMTIIPEQELFAWFPSAGQFLLEEKPRLLKRDKGKGQYPAWYAYGRTQGMNNFGEKLLIPYISSLPIAVLSLEEEVLFYCGYAIFGKEEELRLLKAVLESEVFWYYISNTSKPYSKGYMAFAKNYIARFGIPFFTETEKLELLSFCNSAEKNRWLWRKYGIEQ